MKVKKQYLLKEASQIRSFIEKNNKIPKTCTLGDGTIISSFSVSYLLASLVNDPKQDKVNLVNVIIYHPAKKHVDTISNEDVLKNDYLVMVKNFLRFCEKYHRVPRFITTQKSQIKVSFELFLYCLCKIIVFYQNNNTLPNYCNFNKTYKSNTGSSNKTVKKEDNKSTSKSTNTNIYTSSPHPTKPGCGGMGQDTSYYCGVSALQKCLYKFGIKDFSQKTLAGWAGTTTKGTSHDGIRTAVAYVNKKKGTNIKVTEKTFTEIGGWKGISKILANKNQDIIFHNKYRLKYGHYEVMNQLNLTTNYTKVLNSLGDKCTNTCYCGYVEDRSSKTMKQYMDAVSQKSLLILTKQ